MPTRPPSKHCAVTIGHAEPMRVREPDAVIAAVEPGSIAEQLGLRPGDRIRRVNDQPPRDVIDWQLWTACEELDLLVRPAEGAETVISFEKDEHEDLGIRFHGDLFTPLRVCNNGCLFCFVVQAPPGLRPTVYVKDDDYRLSFLHGHFITLTNLTEQHFERIVGQGLSPLHVSVHASDPDVRRVLLDNAKAQTGWDYLTRLVAAGIECHTQIVCCPDVNNGAVLEQTIDDLEALGDGILSIGVVPVGLTRFQNHPAMRPMTPDEAAAVIDQIDARRAGHGTVPVFAADELYLESGRPLPDSDYYDDFCQLENGIGPTRLFLDDAEDLELDLPDSAEPRQVTVVTGGYGALFLPPLIDSLNAVDGLRVELAVIRNDLFGGNVACAGLLAGRDIIDQLGPRPGLVVVTPQRAFDEQERMLDNVTLADLRAGLATEVVIAADPRGIALACGLDIPEPEANWEWAPT